MNPKPPWPWRRLGMVYAINRWMWTIASSLFQRVGFHFHWIRGEKGKRVCEDMKWKKMESDDYQSQYEGCLRFWIEITTKHVISCSGSVWNRQRCNRWIVSPDLLSDKRRWITMDDSRTQDHIRPRTTIEQVSESVYPANDANQGTTFRPKKRKTHPSGSKGSQLENLITTTLGTGNLREAVKLPPGEDINEWLAINTIDFYNHVNLLYATLQEFCTPDTCPIMNAGLYEYRWADGVAVKEPITVSAPEYVEYLMNWIETQIDNEAIFPQQPGVPFPPNFKDFVKPILKRMFRVYAHIYHCHFKKVVGFEEEAHLNTCFKHFVLFTSEYQLIDEANLAPLKDLVDKILNP
ncbi:unnamed protein product [Brassica oleracea]